ENTQLAITTKGFSAVCSVRLILAIYHNKKPLTTALAVFYYISILFCKQKPLTEEGGWSGG
ncbi:hypothetical protein, partial [Leuconostoc mesenteroides]|uniref:hypothetical protein n=1 Tax=Leuconostoc mesenteroides TaxID=1245 RepID=UPI002360B765